MPAPELHWSFADAPRADSAPDEGPPAPKGPAPEKRPRRTLPRRLIAALASVAAVLGLGAWLFTHLGLLRLQNQLAAQITYEDQRARAGDVPAVLAVQAGNEPLWRDQQAARVRLGLAAPLPAGDMLPTGAPPRLARLDPLGGDLFAATVTRDYADSSGQVYAFDLVQRYRNAAPGDWERLPPDTSALAATSLFEGQWLSITVPAVDMPWLGPALLQADGFIGQACADWGNACRPGQRLVAGFGAAPEAQAAPSLAAGRGALPQLDGLWNTQYVVPSYPRIFDLPPATALSPAGITLPAPLLAGRPHDAAAQAALARSLSVQLLGEFAGQVSGAARRDDDYFLDALVARAEVRHLGASAAPQPATPQGTVAPAALWAAASQPRAPGGWRTDLAARREAFDFINYALAGQPAAADGRLLRELRQEPDVSNWLGTVLGETAKSLPDQWDAQTLDSFAAQPVADWKAYDGLVLVCGDEVFQARGGAAPSLAGNLHIGFNVPRVADISLDRRYLALEADSIVEPKPGAQNNTPTPLTTLLVMDLTNGATVSVTAAPLVTAFGWSAADTLIYTFGNTRLNDTPPPPGSSLLHAYHAATGVNETPIPNQISPYVYSPVRWSADHSALLVGLMDPQLSFAVVTFSPTVQVHRLSVIGDTAALSPDGRQVAYVKYDGPVGVDAAVNSGLDWLDVVDTATGSVTSLAATNDLDLPTGISRFWSLDWSADGQTLAWWAYPFNQGGYVVSAPAGGGPVHVWAGTGQRQLGLAGMSPDGRYLMAVVQQDILDLDQFWLFDRQAAGVAAPLTGWAKYTVWSPGGHQLILAGPAGVSALDPASGQWEWLSGTADCQTSRKA